MRVYVHIHVGVHVLYSIGTVTAFNLCIMHVGAQATERGKAGVNSWGSHLMGAPKVLGPRPYSLCTSALCYHPKAFSEA